jgi:hypothetical protein
MGDGQYRLIGIIRPFEIDVLTFDSAVRVVDSDGLLDGGPKSIVAAATDYIGFQILLCVILACGCKKR